MGRLTKYRPLPDQPYDPRITNMARPLNVPAATGPQAGIPYSDAQGRRVTGGAGVAGWVNKNVTNQIVIQLLAGVSQRVLAYNNKRCGLEIQNQDAAATVNYSLSQDQLGFGLQIGPGGSALYDFTTPPDTLYVFCATANVFVAILEITRTG